MAWTAPRTWTDGELVTKAIMDPHVRDNFIVTTHMAARKSADQIVNNSTVFVNDTHLSLAVGASEAWFVQAWLLCVSNTSADIKFQWTAPASGTFAWGATASPDQTGFQMFATSTNPVALNTIGTAASYGGQTGTFGASLTGIYAGGGTGGTLQLQWAQATAVVLDTKVLTNSILLGTRIA